MVLDTETTGVSHEEDAVVELAAVVTSASETIGWGSSLVNPGRPIRPEASAVHHLTEEHVADAPAIDEAIDLAMSAAVRDAETPVVAYVAHNAPFDRGFLDKHLGGPLPWLDTYRMARRYLTDLPNHANQYLRYALRLDLGDNVAQIRAHRALGDTIVTAALFRYLVAGPAQADFEAMGAEAFAAHVDSPMLLKTVGFGKHFGQPWAMVPRDYLAWLLRNLTDKDQDTMFTIRHYLESR